jgi:hypothetical protein
VMSAELTMPHEGAILWARALCQKHPRDSRTVPDTSRPLVFVTHHMDE